MAKEEPIIIEVQDPASRDRELEQATRLLSGQATDCGVLITRHGFRIFTAELSTGVEYGIIQELDLL